ncbi:MAG: UDP-N-acetylmuramate dehydrogenase [Anaerovibrio sp.]|uniref:UDP-N-acetylmuramate dehydrogenase n=1 Tax=Anaerovibrio sp. TaxID=1872532 RepID=UPI001B1B1CD9|nr:UDP-N-acetylmuramate dehydrogenase [Anaerovibrio sp.]MBO5588849.1 UDP-N-acetylmuramate dehydrogenase [Anaerovibrio sp.]MBO6245045.1 UDP-N-acetylmuramate dehydrogenase [Anaerovibrio sp.]
MEINQEFVDGIKKILPEEQFYINEPMSKHTTFNIGGPADYLIFPGSMDQLQAVVKLMNQCDIPFTILGNGSNVLVLDKGIRGAVIKFHAPMSYKRCEGNKIIAGAGAYLKHISQYAAENGLTGMEFACGIPGSLGGAVFMNAGAYDGEMKNVVKEVKTVTATGKILTYGPDEFNFGYRHSVFQANGQAIAEITLELQSGNKEDIQAKMDDYTARRESKQPLEMPSAGSTFKRPEGYYAGTLIDSTGLKGLQVGGAQISTKHAGFVVNSGHATAQDVLDLIKEVQDRVYKEKGVKLYPEVRIIGEQ